MDHHDHVALLRPAKLPPGGKWADLGAGSGAFTLALRELVGAEGRALRGRPGAGPAGRAGAAWRLRFGDAATLHLLTADFTRPLDHPAAGWGPDGKFPAFLKEKESVLRHVGALLKPGGGLLLVEYNVDAGNIGYLTSDLRDMAPACAAHRFQQAPRVTTHSSSFLGGFYSAVAFKTAEVSIQ